MMMKDPPSPHEVPHDKAGTLTPYQPHNPAADLYKILTQIPPR